MALYLVSNLKYHGDTARARKNITVKYMAKKATKKATRPGRESDAFIVRMPDGMRELIALEAEKNGRSMNAEVVARLAFSFEELLTTEGLIQVSKQMTAAVEFLWELMFDVRDVDLDGYIREQNAAGIHLTRKDAIRKILRAYLSEHGFAKK